MLEFSVLLLLLLLIILLILYRATGAFMSKLQNLIPEAIPIQKCHMNMGPILTCYGAMDI
jgi:hypothetical protein